MKRTDRDRQTDPRQTDWPLEGYRADLGKILVQNPTEKPGDHVSASNIRGVSGRGASPGEVLVVVLVALVVAFLVVVKVVAKPLLRLLRRKPPPGPPQPPPGPPRTKLNKKLNKN